MTGFSEPPEVEMRPKSLFLLVATLLISSSLVRAGEVVDVSTVREGMHACPGDSFVTGIHVGQNKLLCSDLFAPFRSVVGGATLATVDVHTRDQGMHACPAGMAITGIHVGDDKLLCESLRGLGHREIDRDTTRQEMHACPPSTVAVGIHVGQNLLLCSGIETGSATKAVAGRGTPSPGSAVASAAVLRTFTGIVNGVDVIATPGQPVRCLAFINRQKGSVDAVQVETEEARLQSILESASARGVTVEVSYRTTDGRNRLARVRILDR